MLFLHWGMCWPCAHTSFPRVLVGKQLVGPPKTPRPEIYDELWVFQSRLSPGLGVGGAGTSDVPGGGNWGQWTAQKPSLPVCPCPVGLEEHVYLPHPPPWLPNSYKPEITTSVYPGSFMDWLMAACLMSGPSPRRKKDSYSHFSDRLMEAQRGCMTCLGSHSSHFHLLKFLQLSSNCQVLCGILSLLILLTWVSNMDNTWKRCWIFFPS